MVGLSLTFGLLTIVCLLGYGLVEIPVSYFRFASNGKKLKHYQCKVAEYDEQLREKAKKAQTLIQIIKDVKVEVDLQEHLSVLKKDVDQFHERIENLEYFRVSFTPSVSDKSGREFQGVLDYNKLVRLRNRLIYQTTDVIRLISFRREAIETAILLQDIIDGKNRGDRRVQSYYLQSSSKNWGDRDQSRCHNRFMASICKGSQLFHYGCRVFLAHLYEAAHLSAPLGHLRVSLERHPLCGAGPHLRH